jgi:hypothetical protein
LLLDYVLLILFTITLFQIQDEDNSHMQELNDSLAHIESPHTSVHIDLKPITNFIHPFQSDYFCDGKYMFSPNPVAPFS